MTSRVYELYFFNEHISTVAGFSYGENHVVSVRIIFFHRWNGERENYIKARIVFLFPCSDTRASETLLKDLGDIFLII